MTTSEQINEIAAALAKAQGAMKNATLNKTNPHFKNKYADLAGIRDAVTPSLAANGIAVVQTIVPFDGRAAMATRLVHTSGQWMESLCPLPDVGDMQKLGSAITYARRYSLSAICGIAADEDDDANAAVEKPARDEAFDRWLGDLEIVASEQGYDAMVAAIKKSDAKYQERLRADAKTWNALKGKSDKAKAA